MRSLAQPAVLRASALAAAGSTLACWPRLALWTEREDALPFLLAVVAVCSFFLWNFTFAWHERYLQRPVFGRLEVRRWMVATALALVGAAIVAVVLDPVLREIAPQEFPGSLRMWAAMALFHLGLQSVFLVFAPVALFARLFHRANWAGAGTVALMLLVFALKVHASPHSLPAGLLVVLTLARVAGGAFVVWLYLRGGAGLVWWCGLLLEARHLPVLLTRGGE